MSERPKWMPTHEDVEEQSDLHIGWVDDEAMQFLRNIGLRAQIAVLEESPVAFVEVDGKSHLCADHLLWVKNKLAALRKELGE